MPSLLVTNDFPPKIGGIQSYLYELWRRLPPAETTVFTTPYDGASEWDARQAFRVVRADEKLLLPTPALTRRVAALAREVGAQVIFLDPMLPLGEIELQLRKLDQPVAPRVVIGHGAEVSLWGRVPPTSLVARRVLRSVAGVVAAGNYPATEMARVAGRLLPTLVVPPGVDTERFRPATDDERRATRERFGLDPSKLLVLGLSRLVPRKGFDVLIDALARTDLDVQLAIGGGGRDRARLERHAWHAGMQRRVRFLGRVPDDDLAPLYAASDVFAMLCRADRWGGLEAEGFGVVFLEAAGCGVPSIAGRGGGSHEAVADGETGFVVPPRDVQAVRNALVQLLVDTDLRARMGAAARQRALDHFRYDDIVARLLPVTRGDFSSLRPFFPPA
jgi:phosphatidylinositol alpha-1,6-mannosyltransferase